MRLAPILRRGSAGRSDKVRRVRLGDELRKQKFQVNRISGAAVVRACQNRITRCAVVGDSRSKFENALSKPVPEDFTCERERMTARAVGHPSRRPCTGSGSGRADCHP